MLWLSPARTWLADALPGGLDLTSLHAVGDMSAVRQLHFVIGGSRVLSWSKRDWTDGLVLQVSTGDLLAKRTQVPGAVLPVSQAVYHTFGVEVVWDDEALERRSTPSTEPVYREEVEYGDREEYLDHDTGEVRTGTPVIRRTQVETGDSVVVWAPVEVQTPRLTFGTTPTEHEHTPSLNDSDNTGVEVPIWQQVVSDDADWIRRLEERFGLRKDAADGTMWAKNVLRFSSGMAGLCYTFA